MNDLEKGLYLKRMLSYGGLLKQKHKILNLDDAEDGNLEFRKTKLLFKKCETLAQKLAFFLCLFASAGNIAFNRHG